MSKRRDDPKRQLFRGLSPAPNVTSSLDTSSANLLSRTLRKESDKYRRPSDSKVTLEEQQFVIHKSTSPEDYHIFSSNHPLRESRLQAFSQAEAALDEMFRRNGVDDSGSEDDEPDLSSIAPASEIYKDDILISVPGYSREEITASKRLSINDRKNVRLSKVSSLERAFAHNDFLKKMSHDRLREYRVMNEEYNERVEQLKEELKDKKLQEYELGRRHPDNAENEERYHQARLETLRETVVRLDVDEWKFQKVDYLKH